MKKFLLVCFLFVFVLSAWAQERVVSGKVTSSDDGTALPGVNVILKGTTNGTVTDAEGMYKLTIPSGEGTLVISFVGLATQEVAIGSRTTVDVQLASDVTQLSEVFVTAQGIEKTRNELAYAAQKVDGDALAQTRSNNFVNGLSGRVAGLDIKRNNSLGGSTNVVIRGAKSLTGNNQALFVVDGVPIDNSIFNGASQATTTNQATGRGGYDFGNPAADINPDDIATLTVLKGAAATALYGSRASNGVIFITTKKGKAGKGIGLTVNSGVTVGMPDKTTLPEYQKKYGGGYGKFYEDPTLYFLYRDPATGFSGTGTNPALVDPTSEDASWGAKFDPNLMVYQWDAFDPASPNFGKQTPWVAAKNDPNTFLKNSILRNYSFLVDGATDKGYFKFGYAKNAEDGILPNSKMNKDFFNFSANYKLTEKLQVTAAVNVTDQRGLGRYGTGYDERNVFQSFRQWWQMNNDIGELKDAYFRNGQNVTWNWTDPSILKPIYWDNPYWTRYKNYEQDHRIRYFGFLKLDYKITNWLDAMGRASFDSYNDIQEERIAKFSVSVPFYSRYNQSFREYNYDLMLNFHKDINPDLKISGALGFNDRYTNRETIYATTNGGLIVPDLYALSNSLNPIAAPIETDSRLHVMGGYANVTTTWKKMLTIEGSFRQDAASSLPKGNNVYPYGAISGTFVFSELIQSSWLTGGKIRANYAEVGATAPAYSTKDNYVSVPLFGSTPLFTVPSTKNNPLLKPERTKSKELGLEMSFFDGRGGFDVTYYKTNTSPQIIPVTLSRATGYNSQFINAGNVQNEGLEAQVFVLPVKSDAFEWNITANFTRNRNKVVELAPGINTLQLGSYQGGVSIDAALGQPYGAIRGNDFVYTNGQKTINASGYYVSTPTANNIIGNAQPNYLLGISNKLTYKNFKFSFLIDMRNGGQLFNLDLYYGLATGLYKETAVLNDKGNEVRSPVADGGGILLPGVLADGTPNAKYYNATSFGIYGYRRNPAAAFIYNAGYIKLREVILSYSIPSAMLGNGPFKGIELSVIGNNLWIIKKYVPHGDPEDALGAGNLAMGYQSGTLPNVKRVGFNVKLKF
jgi:TonB-linked SusC/RagA family outer membrane protein